MAGADRRFREARARLDEGFRRQIEAVRRAAGAAHDGSAAASAGQDLTPDDNPAGVQMQKELFQLEQRKAQLLVDRTPLHPAVVDVDGRIAWLHHELAAIQQKAAPAVNEPAAPTRRPTVQEPDPAEIGPLRDAVEQASREFSQANEAERSAWQSLHQGAPKSRAGIGRAAGRFAAETVRMAADACRADRRADHDHRRGDDLGRRRLEPAVESVAALRETLSVPVVGVVPLAAPATRRPAWLGKLRLGLMAVGLLLVTACLGAMCLSGTVLGWLP